MSTESSPSAHDPESWVYFDGEFKQYRDVHIGLMTHALHYGTGCFEGIRGYWNDENVQLYLLQAVAHYERLHQSARILMLDLPHSVEELVDTTVELMRRNDYRSDCYIRPILFKSGEGIGLPYARVEASFGIYTTRFGKYVDTENGIRCTVASWRRIPDATVPVRAKVTGAYVNSHLAKSEAQRAGFDEAILMDIGGHVSEGASENLFMRRGDSFVTPPVSSDILEGVTRRMVMELVDEALGLRMEQREIDRSELYVCDELLLCGTGAEVCPVLEVDGRPVGSGKIGEGTAQLQRLFFSAARGEDKRYADWLRPVY